VLSPILVRPVREQLEHDRVIRLLQAKYKRKFEVAINPGNEQTMPVGNEPSPWFPDLVLQSQEKTRKLMGVVEVETTESVNNLEAMSQWAALSKLRAPFHLYVPSSCIDSARRLASDLSIPVAELWAYHTIGDQIRFTLVQRTDAPEPRGRAAAEPAAPRVATPAAAKTAAGGNGRPPAPARPAAPARTREPRVAAARPARRTAAAPAATRRKTTAKAKTAAPRRPAAKTTGRKTAASGSRAQKRR
jgi:hypothetical protein